MLFDPTERHVNPFLFPTRVRPMKQRFVVAMPTDTRLPSPVLVQVRGSWHLSLSTPWLYQVCDSPPHTGKQWPAPLSSVWPDSGALPVHVRTSTRGITGNCPRCVARSLPYPVSRNGKGRKKILEGHPGTPIPQTELFPPEVTIPICS